MNEAEVDASLSATLNALPFEPLLGRYREHNEFLFLDRVLDEALVADMTDEYRRLATSVHRNNIPGVRKCGNLGYRILQERAPTMDALYRSPSFVAFVSRLAGSELELKGRDDEHACSVYSYTERGDRMCYHYDHCGCEHGASYSVIIGLINDSRAEFEAKIHRRDWHRRTRTIRLATHPGSMMIFCGSNLYHSVTPLRAAEERVVLSLAYVMPNKHARGFRRFTENVKDAALYFGVPALFQRNYKR